jgi:glycerol uptake facilitator-like aquaporin
MARALAAEFLGTLLLLAAVVGSGIMGETLAGGNAGIALLGNTLATAAALYVLVHMAGPISGAHFNPAVSLAFAVLRTLPPGRAVAYSAVQIAGGIAGTVLAHAMFGQALVQVGTKARDAPGIWLGEVVAAFALMGTIMACLRHRPAVVPQAVAMVISAGYWFTSSTSFANPAAAIARSLTESFAGIRPADVGPFIAAEILGALLAVACFGWLLKGATDRQMP